MRFPTVLLIAVLASGSAAGADLGHQVADHAATCWTVPVDHRNVDAAIAMRVQFYPDGMVAHLEILDSRPKGSIGSEIARSASSAVIRCAPYHEAEGRTVELLMTASRQHQK